MKITGGPIVLIPNVLFPLTLVVTYSVSLHHKHIIAIFPYISNTGNYPVESCIFSLGLNIVAALYTMIAHLRYVQMKELLPEDLRKGHILNKSSLITGIVASVALSMTANFQQTNIIMIHEGAALLCSYMALLYFWHQNFLATFCSGCTKRRIMIFRITLTVVSTLAHMTAPGVFLYSVFGHKLPKGSVTEWINRDEIAAGLFRTGSSLEWIVFVCNLLYMSSFYSEFKKISIEAGSIVVTGGPERKTKDESETERRN
ncbi:UNVERIFIED_CONTAM: hypothetical protein PYX00_006801 [Menopon gallinae]|uniref:CWH43-like N-terminal domain-containing protein n=1 Tax=Menopon gallinae TaxID=328185 RepID=A0AAW2HX21_9NEOP